MTKDNTMHNKINYKQINWTDGMKINKDHFIGLENYFTACDADVRRIYLDEYSYGLMPLKSPKDKNLEFEAFIDDQKNLKVKVLTCRAITQAGYLIDISNGSTETSNGINLNVEATLAISNMQEKEFYVVISVNPFSRIPIGQAVSSERPLRQPLVIPEYSLQIVHATPNILASLEPDLLPLGKISVVNIKPEIDTTYIPPCTSMNCHNKLQEFHEFATKSINALEMNVVELIAEVNLKATSKALIDIILYLAENLLYYLNDKIFEFKWLLKSKPPVFLISSIVSMAHTIKNAIETRTPEEREKLLNYFSQHFDINPAKFKQLLDITIGIDYQHTDINQSFIKAEDFINVISLLFNELKKMEFIEGVTRTRKIDIIIR